MKTVQLFEEGKFERSEPIKAPLELLHRCGGYYECPKDPKGKRLGPLVAYAGRDKQGRQYVGDVYANFAKAERHSPIIQYVAERLIKKIGNCNLDGILIESTGFIGAPEGGKALACYLASASCRIDDEHSKQYIFPEKKITALATENSREKSELVWNRHAPEPGEKWWIVEDVCNNFATTSELVTLVEKCEAAVVGIVCFLNRSLTVDTEYIPKPEQGRFLPVIALVRKPIQEYTHDDPEVIGDILAGNVVWKPKNEWEKLMKAMG